MKASSFVRTAALVGCVVAATPVAASAQAWANWSNAACGVSASGSFGSTTVTYTGGFNAMQKADGSDVCNSISQSGGKGNNYWTVDGTNNSGAYAVTPDNVSFIQYSPAASGTITFSQAVIDPYIALISVGQPNLQTTLTFSDPFTIISRNNTLGTMGYWDAAPDVNSFVSGNTIVSTEFSGLIQFKGTFNSLTIATTGENWHGFTVGAVSVVPEPTSVALMAFGLVGLGVVVARRKRAA